MAKHRPLAPAQQAKAIRCAIYTRKSTEDGLEQEFNSLDAQREACAAYVTSQRHEGWTLVPGDYDDGGFSGGTLERPALKCLLDEVAAGRVDVIVVYKIDRLTRSLADFSRIVDVLDAKGASFVSVTQAFNTTTSMGRLTLNVLLSFAQFEREVTGERIRDKIAASKARGMWMGGVVPLGYGVVDRKLVVDEEHAATVRSIFARYLALSSVLALHAELEGEGVTSRPRVARSGRAYGGKPLTRGALYAMLQNRIYVGEVTHKGVAHVGEHQAIATRELFDQVQDQLERNRAGQSVRLDATQPSLLAGILFDEHGRRMSPSHAVKQVKRYRYYVSRTDGPNGKLPVWRVPAGDLEELVVAKLRSFLTDAGAVHDAIACAEPDAVVIDGVLSAAGRLARQLAVSTAGEHREQLLRLVRQVEVHAGQVRLHIARAALLTLGGRSPVAVAAEDEPVILATAAKLARVGKEVRLVVAPAHGSASGRRDPALIKLIVKAQAARAAVEQRSQESIEEIARSQDHARDYFGVLLKLGYLAPDITAAILEGRQPAELTRQKLCRLASLPHDWQAQRLMFGAL